MAIASRLRELDSRHRDLKTRIQTAAKQPSVDWSEITELKRIKLKLKEQIEGLRSQH